MATETPSSDSSLGMLFRLLVTYRLLIYLGGLILIGVPRVIDELFGIELSPGARTAIVVVSLGLMIVTYIGERRVGSDHVDEASGRSNESYSLRLRVILALSVTGIAVGIYVALEISRLTGILFIVGAYFFGHMGYKTELGDDDE